MVGVASLAWLAGFYFLRVLLYCLFRLVFGVFCWVAVLEYVECGCSLRGFISLVLDCVGVAGIDYFVA